MPERKGSILCKVWGIEVNQALYSEWGNFYGLIKSYPAALLDSKGYFIIISPESLNRSGVYIRKRINIPKGISSLPGYVQMIKDEILLPEEIPETDQYSEGSVSKITVNRYERDKKARLACVSHYGYNCAVCDTNLEKIYGEIAHDFTHVHHLKAISSIGEKYEINPIDDLRPICPNCHAIIHHRNPPFSIEEVKTILLRKEKTS